MTRDVLLKTLRELGGDAAQKYSDDDLLYRTANEYKNQGRLGEIPQLEHEYNRINAEIEVAGRGFFGDVYAAGKRGLAQGRQSFNVWQGADDPTNAQDIADAQKTIDLNPVSEKYREFQSTSKDDTLGWLKAFAKNPITITSEVITESLGASLPSMAGGMIGGAAEGAIAGAAASGANPVATGIGAAIGAGAGSFAVEYASKTLDVMRDGGMDLNDPASIQSFFRDPAKLAEAKDLAIKRAIPVGIFDAATAGLAGKFLGPLHAAKKAGEKVAISRVLGATGKEVGLQAAGGMLGEFGGQVASGEEIDPRSIFMEGIAEVGSAPSEIRSNLREIRGSKPKETIKAQPYTEENAAATTAKAAIRADIPEVKPFFTPSAETAQTNTQAVPAPTVESIAEKVMSGNTNLTSREVEYASIPEVSDQIKAAVESKTEQMRTEAAQAAAMKSARKPGDQMTFGDQSVVEAARTVGEPVIREIDSTPVDGEPLPYVPAKGEEDLFKFATRTEREQRVLTEQRAKQVIQAAKEKAKAEKQAEADRKKVEGEQAADIRSRMIRVPRSEFRGEVAPTPTPAPEGTIPFPVDAAAKRVRERAALVRNAGDAEFIDFTTGEKMNVPLATAPDTTVPFAPVAPVETPTVTSTPVAETPTSTETTPPPVSTTIPSAEELVQSSLDLPADIKGIKERIEGRLAAVAETSDGTVHLLPLVRGEDGATYVQQISKFENKGALVDALAESYAGQKGFSKSSLRKLIINEAPFTADGNVNQEQMRRLYENPATRDKWTPVVQRALELGILQVGSKRTKLSEYLSNNEMVSSGTAVVTKTPLKNPIKIGSPLESITAKTQEEKGFTAKDAVKSAANSAKLDEKRVAQVADRLDLVAKEKIEEIRSLLSKGSEEAQVEVDKIVGVNTGDTPEYRNRLFTAADNAKQTRDAVAAAKLIEQPAAAPTKVTATPVLSPRSKKDRPKVRAPEAGPIESTALKSTMSVQETAQLTALANLKIGSPTEYKVMEDRLTPDRSALSKKIGSPEFQNKVAALIRGKLEDAAHFESEAIKSREVIRDSEDIIYDDATTNDTLNRVQPDVAKAREGLRHYENPEQYLAPKDDTLLDRIVYAMAERGLKVSISEATKEMKAGGTYSPSKRTVALVLDSVDNPSKQSVITALHEITHDILADAPEDIHRAIHDVIERTPNGQLAFYKNPEADPRLATDEGMTKEELNIERAVEHLALQNIDREYSRGLIQSIYRTAKDLFLRAAIYLQKNYIGDENTTGRLAEQWANNQVAKVLAGDAQTFDRFLSQFGVKPTLADVVRMSTDERGRTFSMKADFTGRSITYRPIRSLDSAELNIDAALASAKETAKANGTWTLDSVLGELEKTLGPTFARVQPGEFDQYNGNLAVQRVLAEARSSVAVANSLHPIVEKFYQKVKSVQVSYTPAQRAAMKRNGIVAPREITSVEDLYKVLRMADPRQRAAQIYEHAKSTLESEFGTTVKEDLFDRTVTIEKLEKGVVADMADQMMFRELVRLNNKTSSRIDGLKTDIQGLRLASEKNRATIRSVMDALSDMSVTRRLLDRSIAEQFREIRRDLKLSSENAEAMGEAAGILEALEGETKRRDLSARFNEKLFEGIVIDELPLNSYFKSLDEVLKAKGLILAESNVKDIRSAVIAAVRANPDIPLKDLVSLGEGPMAKDRGTALLTTLIGFSKNEKLVSEIIRVQMTRGEERVAAINELRRVHGEVSEKVLSGLAEDIKKLSKPTADFTKLGTTHATPTTTAAQRLLNARDEALMDQTRLARMERDLSVLTSANSIFDQLVNVADQRLKIGSSFVLSNDSNFINAGSVTDTDESLLEGSKANKLTLYGSKAMSNDQLREILQRNREWIEARKNSPEKQGRVYNSLERQNEEMARFIFGSQARELIVGIRNGYFTNLAELSARTGTAGGARMASALTQFVGWQRIFRAEAEVAGKKFERARADFEKASGVDPSTFKTLFYDEARWFMDTYASTEKDAFTELNKRFRENVSASRYWSKPGAPEAFFALMRSVKENAAIQNKWMSITGANRVADDRLTDVNVFDQKTSQPMERRQLETGVSGYTTYRNLNESLSGWAAAFRLKIEGDGKNNPFADIKLKTDLTQQTATLSAQLKALFNDNDWSVFLNPILLNEMGGVPGPRKADGVRSQTSPRVVAEAVSMAGNDLVGIADRIYAAEGGNPEGAAAYRSQFLSWIYGRWQQVDRITQKEIPTGQNISLRTPSLGVDARTSQFMPREWLTYPQYTPEDHSRAAHAIASTGSFGRNAEVLVKAIKDVVDEIAVKKNEVAAAGEGLNPDAVDNEAWLAFKKKNPTEYKRLKEIAEYRPPNFAEIYSDVLNTEGEFWTQWHTSREVYAAMTTGMTAGLKSAVKNLVSTSNLFAMQKSGSGEVFKTVGGAYAKTGKLFLGSVTQLFGLDLYKDNAALQAMMRNGAFDASNHATFKDKITGERGVNDSMSSFATFLRKMRQVFSNQKLSPFEGGTAPAIRLLNPFQFTQQLVNMANTWQLMETYMDMAQSAASVYRADPKSSRALTAKDAGMTDEVAYKARIELLQNNGYSLEDLARKVAQGRNPFDEKLVMATNNISTTVLANEGSAISRPVGLTRSKGGQLLGTFVGWSIEQTNRVLRLLETPEGRMNAGSVARGLGVLGITMLPATLAYAALLDEWDELVEKKQNRRPVSDGPGAWLEAATSVGTFGLAAEFADYVSSSRQGSSGYNDALSLDNRIVLVSSARQMAQAIRNVVQADVENTNYANIIRPFLQAAGAGGIIQNAYILDRVLGNQLQELPVVGGVVKAEASVALRSNVYNYLRSTAREAGLEVRQQGGGGYAITPMTPYITNMALAALSGDNAAFQEAYRGAVIEARKKHSDPFKAVQLAFAARHPYKSLFVGTPTAQEVMKLRQNMPEAGQEAVNTAVRNFDVYSARLGIPPFMGSTGMSDAQMIRMRNNAQAPSSMLDSVYDRASQLRSAF
jgi:hypothetical protein